MLLCFAKPGGLGTRSEATLFVLQGFAAPAEESAVWLSQHKELSSPCLSVHLSCLLPNGAAVSTAALATEMGVCQSTG